VKNFGGLICQGHARSLQATANNGFAFAIYVVVFSRGGRRLRTFQRALSELDADVKRLFLILENSKKGLCQQKVVSFEKREISDLTFALERIFIGTFSASGGIFRPPFFPMFLSTEFFF